MEGLIQMAGSATLSYLHSNVSSEPPLHCEEYYGFLPCSVSAGGSFFLMLVYGGILLFSAKLISDGSELLLEVLDPGIVGGLVLPVLGALPDSFMIAVSGLAGPLEEAQKEVAVGMGTLAGSTIMLLTIAWGLSLVLGRCDLDDKGRALDRVREDEWEVWETGVTTDGTTPHNAWIMLASTIPLILVQAPSLFTASVFSHAAAVTSLVLSVIMLLAYCLYQVLVPELQLQRMKAARERFLQSFSIRSMHRLAVAGGSTALVRLDGTPDDEALQLVFAQFDVNGDGMIDEHELKMLICGLTLGANGFVPRDCDVEFYLRHFDTDNSSTISLEEFISGMHRWMSQVEYHKHLLKKLQAATGGGGGAVGGAVGGGAVGGGAAGSTTNHIAPTLDTRQNGCITASRSSPARLTRQLTADASPGPTPTLSATAAAAAVAPVAAPPAPSPAPAAAPAMAPALPSRSPTGLRALDLHLLEETYATPNMVLPSPSPLSYLPASMDCDSLPSSRLGQPLLPPAATRALSRRALSKSRSKEQAQAGEGGSSELLLRVEDDEGGEVEEVEEEEEEDEEDEEEDDNLDEDEKRAKQRAVVVQAVAILFFGTVVLAVFSDPMVDAVSSFASLSRIPPFFVSFVITPLASNASELYSSLMFARKMRRRNITLTFSQIYGAVTMNNTLCLAVFLSLVVFRGITWDFSAEVTVLLTMILVVGVLGSSRTTFRTWLAGPVLLLYPASLALVAFLDYVLLWS